MGGLLDILLSIRVLTWRAVLGLVLIAAAYVLPRVVAMSVSMHDLLEHAYLIGNGLLLAEAAAQRKNGGSKHG